MMAPANNRSLTADSRGLQLRLTRTKRGELAEETEQAIRKLEDEVERLVARCEEHEQRMRLSLNRLQTTLYVKFPYELATLDEIDIRSEETSSALLLATSSSIPPLEARLRAVREKADDALRAFENALGGENDGADLGTRVEAVKERLVKERRKYEHDMQYRSWLRRVLRLWAYALTAIISTLILVGYLSRG